MLYNKLATTIDDQILLLKERGMVGDEALMRRWLETVGYYRLSAYWLPFEARAADTAILHPEYMCASRASMEQAYREAPALH